jgi:hypothetical protein
MIDNSQELDYYELLKSRGVNVIHLPRGGNSRQALATAQNYARKKAYNEGFDYLLSIESDLIIQPDTLKRLLSHNRKIVGATYYIGTNFKIP